MAAIGLIQGKAVLKKENRRQDGRREDGTEKGAHSSVGEWLTN